MKIGRWGGCGVLALCALSGGAVCRALECDFPLEDAAGLDPEAFYERFVETKTPVVFHNATQGWPAMQEWQWSNLSNAFEGVPLRVGPGPYPSVTMSINEYLQKAEYTWENEEGGVPGVFQYGQVPTSWSLWAHKDQCIPNIAFFHPNSLPIHQNFSLACDLLSKIEVPRFIAGTRDRAVSPIMITHSGFLIGYTDSGIDFHAHQSAINVVFDGQKEWFMKVKSDVVRKLRERQPNKKFFCERDPEHDLCVKNRLQQERIKELRAASADQQVFKLPSLKSKTQKEKFFLGGFANSIASASITEELLEDSELLHCVQEAGEVVYIPQMTPHAVRNLAKTVAMQMQFDNETYKNKEERKNFYRRLIHDLDPREPDPSLFGINQVAQGQEGTQRAEL